MVDTRPERRRKIYGGKIMSVAIRLVEQDGELVSGFTFLPDRDEDGNLERDNNNESEEEDDE